MQFLLKKRSATFPRRQPSGGFGKICHVHPERAHICRCINFTTIPQRIQDKCITFILLLYISPRNPCNCDTPYCEHLGTFAGVTQVTRISAVLHSTRLRVPHPQKNIFRRIRPVFRNFVVFCRTRASFLMKYRICAHDTSPLADGFGNCLAYFTCFPAGYSHLFSCLHRNSRLGSSCRLFNAACA